MLLVQKYYGNKFYKHHQNQQLHHTLYNNISSRNSNIDIHQQNYVIVESDRKPESVTNVDQFILIL